MKAHSENELLVIKQLCLAKDSEISPALSEYKTPHAIACVVAINEIASQISRREVFKGTVMDAMKVCLPAI